MKDLFLYGKFLVGQLLASITPGNIYGWILKVGLLVWGLFSHDIHLLVIITLCLTIIDTVTGVFASLKQGIKFKVSRLLRKGLLEKLLIYNLLILSVWLLAKVLVIAFALSEIYIVAIIVILIDCYELSSIIEKLQILAPNLPFLKVLDGLVASLQKGTVERAENAIKRAPLPNKTETDGTN